MRYFTETKTCLNLNLKIIQGYSAEIDLCDDAEFWLRLDGDCVVPFVVCCFPLVGGVIHVHTGSGV